jgi:hypothetical protein
MGEDETESDALVRRGLVDNPEMLPPTVVSEFPYTTDTTATG